MIRTFATHKIRPSREISSCLWSFQTLSAAGDTPSGPVPAPIPVAVPSCWETYPATAAYRGRAVYSRKFTPEMPAAPADPAAPAAPAAPAVPAASVAPEASTTPVTSAAPATASAPGAPDVSEKLNVRLEFKGVSHTARVLVDGQPVGGHYNAYTPFEVLLPGLAAGQHTLAVIADNAFSPASALHVPNDYQSYGGISRGVVLETLGDAYIRWLHFTPVCGDLSADQWRGSAEVCLVNLSEKAFAGELELCLAGRPLKSLPVRLAPKETAVLSCDGVPCPDVRPWSPDDPVLYFLSAVLREGATRRAVDDLIERVGFREVRITGRDILLNGQKLRIKGFCRHEDHPQFGCAIPFSAMQYDLMLIKDLGGNSVRTSHYPNDELFLDLCDEQGILVWEENHARGLSAEQMSNPNFERQCEDCIREMITAHYNHPCIYIWGILNECASHTDTGKACYQAQYALIRSLDKSRPRSSASCQFKTDICFGLPEVVAYNIYPKWYHDTPAADYLADLYGWVRSSSEGRGKPFLITEVGAGAIYGYRTPGRVKWSEEYQAQALEEQLRAIFAQEGCSGVYIWQFCDTNVCDSWFEKRPRTMNNKGVVDEYRRPKLAYQTVKKLFHEIR